MTTLRNKIIGAGGIGRLVLESEDWKRLLAGFTAILLFGGTTVLADLTNGLVAYYPFDGNANDVSGNGNHGVIHGATFETNDALGGWALRFDGTSGYVEVPASTSLEPADGISVSLWVKGAPPAGSSTGTILRKTVACGPGYTIRTANFRPDVTETFQIDYGCGPRRYDTPFTPCKGTQWQHFAATYSRAQGWITTYADGVEVSRTALTSPLQHSGNLWIGGALVDPVFDGFDGLVDEVRIYNRALSLSDIQELVGGNCHSLYTQDFSSDPGWTASDINAYHWNADGTYTLTMADASGSYATTPVSLATNQSFRFEFDVKITRMDWAGDVNLGLFSEGRDAYNRGTAPYLKMNFGNGDLGNGIGVNGVDSSGTLRELSQYPSPYALNTWYHATVAFDHDAKTLAASVIRRSDGQVIWSDSLSGFQHFNGLVYLGSSKIGDNYAPGHTGGAIIDNVVLCQAAVGSNAPPMLTCPPATVVECGLPTQLTAQVSDPEGDAMVMLWSVNGTAVQTNLVPVSAPGTTNDVSFSGEFSLGTNVLGISVTDGASVASCTTTVTVADTVPPVIMNVVASPNVLWPPNHQMVEVNIRASVNDECGPAGWRIIGVQSSEPANGRGTGNTSPDWQRVGDHAVLLRAERSGGDSRIYTITVQATDASGNRSQRKTVSVEVPKSQGKAKSPEPPTPPTPTPVSPMPPRPPALPPLPPSGLRAVTH